ncbi:putative membrane protein [Catenulispora sp. MAP12-49]
MPESVADTSITGVARAADADETTSAAPRTTLRATLRTPAVLAAATTVVYTVFALRRHFLFRTYAYDLGIFGQGVRSYAAGHLPTSTIRSDSAPSGPWGHGFPLLGDHFSPIVGVLGPLYRLWPHIELLLIAQSVLVGCSVFIVARRAAPHWWLAVAYAMSWGLQGLVNFDFHEVAFAVPLIALALDAYLAQRWVACAWWAASLLLVKEDAGLTLAVFGLLLWRHDRRIGGVLCVAGPVATALLVLVVIPHFNPQHVYPYLQSTGRQASAGSALSQPWLIPVHLVWPATKLKTLAMLLIPTALLALRSPLILVGVPTLLMRFTSADHMYWGTDYHYSAILMPIVFFALIDALACSDTLARSDTLRWRPDLRPTRWVPARWVPAVVTVVTIGLVPLSPLRSVFDPGFWHDGPRTASARQAVALVPAGAHVAASNALAPHLTDTAQVYLATDTVFAHAQVDWVVLDTDADDWLSHSATIIGQAQSAGFRQVFNASGYVVLRR